MYSHLMKQMTAVRQSIPPISACFYQTYYLCYVVWYRLFIKRLAQPILYRRVRCMGLLPATPDDHLLVLFYSKGSIRSREEHARTGKKDERGIPAVFRKQRPER